MLEGKRKFIFYMFAFGACALLVGLGKLDGKYFEFICWGIFAGFSGGNYGEHWTKMKSKDNGNNP